MVTTGDMCSSGCSRCRAPEGDRGHRQRPLSDLRTVRADGEAKDTKPPLSS